MTRRKLDQAIYKAQGEIDHLWEELFEAHVVLNEHYIHFFASPDSESYYKRGYLQAIRDTNDKYGVFLTRSTYDTALNNTFQSSSIQSYRTDYETLTWEELYPTEMKEAREAAQKKQECEAQKDAKDARLCIKKWITAPRLTIENDIIVPLDIISL
jgi:hypothetical protein